MSTLRATVPASKDCPAPGSYADALYMIRDSVRRRDKLIFGKLENTAGECCAVGAFFHDNPRLALDDEIIEEVAAYNDSIPKGASEKERKRKVLAWLNFKLKLLTKDGGKP